MPLDGDSHYFEKSRGGGGGGFGALLNIDFPCASLTSSVGQLV